jgi:hypothetical protein
MTYDRIVIWTSPVEKFQKLYVFKDGVLVDQMGIAVDDLNDTLEALISKYTINRLDFSGAHAYAEGLVKDFQEKSMLDFGVNDIRINYV